MVVSPLVLLPYRYTLFSNLLYGSWDSFEFYHLIDIHYSQTAVTAVTADMLFYYLIDLQYSQTHSSYHRVLRRFYYLIDLHYSQTDTEE